MEKNMKPFYLDLNNIDTTTNFYNMIFNHKHDIFQNGNSIYLVNNAGICLSGCNEYIMKTSLSINTIGPIQLAIYLIEIYLKTNIASNNCSVNIINISSGEGELVCINSEIASQLKSMTTLPELDVYIQKLLTRHQSEIEFAFGDSPCYSLSKAILNTATRILHDTYASNNLRIISICPGNFISRMTTELEAIDAVDASEAARVVLETIFDSENCPSGGFYRHKASISM
jgi:NAD(P)-dependent dehydrogenase (short-subunit alcohol dehydrogenase family)